MKVLCHLEGISNPTLSRGEVKGGERRITPGDCVCGKMRTFAEEDHGAASADPRCTDWDAGKKVAGSWRERDLYVNSPLQCE